MGCEEIFSFSVIDNDIVKKRTQAGERSKLRNRIQRVFPDGIRRHIGGNCYFQCNLIEQMEVLFHDPFGAFQLAGIFGHSILIQNRIKIFLKAKSRCSNGNQHDTEKNCQQRIVNSFAFQLAAKFVRIVAGSLVLSQ